MTAGKMRPKCGTGVEIWVSGIQLLVCEAPRSYSFDAAPQLVLGEETLDNGMMVCEAILSLDVLFGTEIFVE